MGELTTTKWLWKCINIIIYTREYIYSRIRFKDDLHFSLLKHNESTASKLQITAFFLRRLRLSSSLSFEFALISEISFHFSSSEVDAKMNSRELLFWSIKEPVDDVIYNHNNDEDSEMRKRTQEERFFIFHEEVGRKARIEIFAVQKKFYSSRFLFFHGR